MKGILIQPGRRPRTPGVRFDLADYKARSVRAHGGRHVAIVIRSGPGSVDKTLRRLALPLALLVAACGGGGDSISSPADDTTTRPAAVEIRTFRFAPSPLEVEAGTTVRWTNRDDIEHTVTAGTPEALEQSFDGSLAKAGDTFEHTFAEPGTYVYFCRRHTSMTGRVVVS